MQISRIPIHTSLLFMLLLFSCVKNNVYAQNSYWYGGVSTGDASIADDIYDASTPISLFIGKRLNESTAFEVGYLDLGGFESDSRDHEVDPVNNPDASADISGIEVSALFLAKVGESVEIYGRAGLYLWDGEEVIDGDESDDSDISPLLGLGLNFPIGARFGARAEYALYRDIVEEDSDAIFLGAYIKF